MKVKDLYEQCKCEDNFAEYIFDSNTWFCLEKLDKDNYKITLRSVGYDVISFELDGTYEERYMYLTTIAKLVEKENSNE